MKSDIKVYTEEEIKRKLQDSIQGWEYDGKWIRKTFKTHNWKSTLIVINTILLDT